MKPVLTTCRSDIAALVPPFSLSPLIVAGPAGTRQHADRQCQSANRANHQLTKLNCPDPDPARATRVAPHPVSLLCLEIVSPARTKVVVGGLVVNELIAATDCLEAVSHGPVCGFARVAPFEVSSRHRPVGMLHPGSRTARPTPLTHALPRGRTDIRRWLTKSSEAREPSRIRQYVMRRNTDAAHALHLDNTRCTTTLSLPAIEIPTAADTSQSRDVWLSPTEQSAAANVVPLSLSRRELSRGRTLRFVGFVGFTVGTKNRRFANVAYNPLVARCTG